MESQEGRSGDNGRKQHSWVIELCEDMKNEGTEATRTKVLVGSVKTGKWGRKDTVGRDFHTEASMGLQGT